MKYLKAFLVTAVSYFVIDLIARMVILGPLSASDMAGITRPMTDVNKVPLMLEYLLLPAALIYFLVATGVFKKEKSSSFKFGTVLGLTVFGMFELVNGALLLKWSSAGVSVINALGGSIIVGLTAVAASWALRKFNSK